MMSLTGGANQESNMDTTGPELIAQANETQEPDEDQSEHSTSLGPLL